MMWRLRLAVLHAREDHPDRGLAGVVLGQRRRLGQQELEELHRDHRRALVVDGIDARHADVGEHLEVLDVVVGEGHPEADLLQALDVLDEALLLLVIDEVGLDRADLGIVDHRRDAQRIDLDPLAVLPVLAALGDLAQVDLGIEVGGERLAVAAGVAVDDVDGVDLVEQLLLRVGAEDVGDARDRSRSPAPPSGPWPCTCRDRATATCR